MTKQQRKTLEDHITRVEQSNRYAHPPLVKAIRAALDRIDLLEACIVGEPARGRHFYPKEDGPKPATAPRKPLVCPACGSAHAGYQIPYYGQETARQCFKCGHQWLEFDDEEKADG